MCLFPFLPFCFWGNVLEYMFSNPVLSQFVFKCMVWVKQKVLISVGGFSVNLHVEFPIFHNVHRNPEMPDSCPPDWIWCFIHWVEVVSENFNFALFDSDPGIIHILKTMSRWVALHFLLCSIDLTWMAVSFTLKQQFQTWLYPSCTSSAI